MLEMKAKVKKALSFDIVRFCLVGGVNTVIDFVILNTLFISFGMDRIPANIISTTCAMTFSYIVNRKIVFRHESDKHHRQIVLFLAITLFGLYVLQTGVIIFLTRVWHWPTDLAVDLLPNLDRDVLATNVAKVFATACTLVWNYLGYKYIVFKNE